MMDVLHELLNVYAGTEVRITVDSPVVGYTRRLTDPLLLHTQLAERVLIYVANNRMEVECTPTGGNVRMRYQMRFKAEGRHIIERSANTPFPREKSTYTGAPAYRDELDGP